MPEFNDDTIMPFGKHRKEKLEDVPAKYLYWFWCENESDYADKVNLNKSQRNLMEYIEDNLDSIEP